jgi:O6-methylguanine-DNA--protein-cysteine methyltransferase
MKKWMYLACISLLKIVFFVGCSTTKENISNDQQSVDNAFEGKQDTSTIIQKETEETPDSELKEKMDSEENEVEQVLPEIEFLQTVDLDFVPVEMSQLTEEYPQENWELVKEIPFGSVYDVEVKFSIYKEKPTVFTWWN